MTLIKRVEKWQKDLADLSVEKGKAEGRLEQAKADLKALGFDSIESAKAYLDLMLVRKKEAEETAEELLAIFEEKYADYIE